MYYGRDNEISIYSGERFVGTVSKSSRHAQDLKNLLISALGVLPPYSATVDGDECAGTLSISFFNEFDARSIPDEKMDAIVDKMAASGEYSVEMVDATGASLTVSYRKN